MCLNHKKEAPVVNLDEKRNDGEKKAWQTPELTELSINNETASAQPPGDDGSLGGTNT